MLNYLSLFSYISSLCYAIIKIFFNCSPFQFTTKTFINEIFFHLDTVCKKLKNGLFKKAYTFGFASIF